MKYEKPEMELLELEAVDVITVSNTDYDSNEEPKVNTPSGSWGE